MAEMEEEVYVLPGAPRSVATTAVAALPAAVPVMVGLIIGWCTVSPTTVLPCANVYGDCCSRNENRGHMYLSPRRGDWASRSSPARVLREPDSREPDSRSLKLTSCARLKDFR